MTNKERLEANNAKIEAIQKTLNNKILKASGQGDYFVKVIDYDGTILKEANLNAGDTFELPSPPSHDGLVFQEWSCSQDIVDNTITVVDNNVMVGATYTTASGLSEFDIEITKALEADIATNGFVVNLKMNGTKHWGDGTSDDLTTHTYYDYGKYTIKCNGTTISTGSSINGVLNNSSSVKNYYCTNVRLGHSLTSIPSSSFRNCYSLTSITIPNSIKTIGQEIFKLCPILKSVVIPKGVTTIDYYICDTCYTLTSIIIPNGVTTIKDYAFQLCYLLANVVIPNSVTTIGQKVFSSCHNLTSIIIPNGVTGIKDSTFSTCYSLTDITIPNGVTTISQYAFNYCHILKNINIPNSVTYIGQNVFSSCYNLTNINMPENIKTIANSVFTNCRGITKYDFSNCVSVPTLSSVGAFSDINPTAKIIVPDNLYDEWIVATNWATYANYIYKASEVQE